MSADENESLNAIERTLDEVDRALERLHKGTYRRCEVCDSPIGESELERDPVRSTCDAHVNVT